MSDCAQLRKELRDYGNRQDKNAALWDGGCLSVTFVLLIVVFVSGSIRRRNKSGKLQVLSWLPYTLLFFMIPYAYSHVKEYNATTSMDLIGQVLLMYIYGSVDNFNALNLADRRHGGAIYYKELVQALVLLYVFVVVELFIRAMAIDEVPFILIVILGMLKIVERVIAIMYATCQTPALRSCPLLNTKYNDARIQDNEADPVGGCRYLVGDSNDHGVHVRDDEDLVKGCRYLMDARVSHENSNDDGVTVSKVFQCEGESLLSSDKDQSNQLKDTCLSFSLFWLLLRRFAGFPLHESSHSKEAWRFVRYGLLVQQGDHERAIRVVEVELSFLYDLFYSKYFYFYQTGIIWQLFKRFLFLGSITWVVILYRTAYYKQERAAAKERTPSFELYYDFEATATYIMLAIVTLLELIQLISFITSRWVKLRILCKYVRRESWKRTSLTDFCIKKATQIILRTRLHESLKTWRSELSQYSLLDSCSYLQILPSKILNAISLATGLFVPRHGRRESKSISLSCKVKRAVILSSQKHGPKLTKGLASLQHNELPTQLKDRLSTWSTKFENDARVILVWHVATSLCEYGDVLPASSCQSDHFEVATSLSKYCAYLVAFAPELLPGHVATTESTCDSAVEEAYRLTKPFKKSGKIRRDRVWDLIHHVSSTTDVEIDDQDKIVEQGVNLAKALMTEIIDPDRRWEVLASFWSEMILFLAPNATNATAHAEKLGDGGEFITHLWVLLIHAGIVDRNSFNKDL